MRSLLLITGTLSVLSFSFLLACKPQASSKIQAGDGLDAFNEATVGCACADTACWNDKIHHQQIEAAKCALATAVTTIHPGLGVHVPKLIECAVVGGISIHDLYAKFQSCASLAKNSQSGSAPPTINDALGCALGGTGSLTGTLLACMNLKSPIPMDVALVVAACGVQVAQGSTMLVGNTGCLLSDVQKAWASRPDLDPNAPIFSNPNADKASCNGQPVHCALTEMERYGRWLYQNGGTFVFSRRSEYCAAQCGNGSQARATCERALNANGFSVSSGCRDVCGVAQCADAIDMCLGACCDKEGQCASEARGLMGGRFR
jgi:hypothetical protein